MSYNEDLAYIHDAAFSDMSRNAAVTLLRLLRQRNIKDGLVVDLGCGSGALAQQLTRAGYDVLGIDASAAMLERARERAPFARFERGSVFAVNIPQCIAVTAVGEPINYLSRPKARIGIKDLFRRVHNSLVHGGVFLFDFVHSTSSRCATSHFQGADWAILVTTKAGAGKRILTRRMTVFRKVAGAYRRSQETHYQEIHSKAQVKDELIKLGFKVRPITGYGKQPLLPGRAAFICTKM